MKPQIKSTYLILNLLTVVIGSPILIAFVWFIIISTKNGILDGIDFAVAWIGITIFYYILLYFKILPFLIVYIIAFLFFKRNSSNPLIVKIILTLILLIGIFINFYSFNYNDTYYILISLGYYLPAIASGIFIDIKDDKKFFGL